ncbi:hypothetical protein INT45_001125 [Circinella minor]|uniref:Uncharacterized protein n=1 Tax=Circinella minor TaxID=1195481 RepID=A0A8H7R5Y3_9FUNG|nr:hypothetical protein INT45_001125 [Circinella minor]
MGPIKLPFVPRDILPNILLDYHSWMTIFAKAMLFGFEASMNLNIHCAVELKFFVNTPRFLARTLVLGAGSSQMHAGLEKDIRKIKDEEIARCDIASLRCSHRSPITTTAVHGGPSNGAVCGARSAGVGWGGSQNVSGGGAQNEDEDDPMGVD